MHDIDIRDRFTQSLGGEPPIATSTASLVGSGRRARRRHTAVTVLGSTAAAGVLVAGVAVGGSMIDRAPERSSGAVAGAPGAAQQPDAAEKPHQAPEEVDGGAEQASLERATTAAIEAHLDGFAVEKLGLPALPDGLEADVAVEAVLRRGEEKGTLLVLVRPEHSVDTSPDGADSADDPAIRPGEGTDSISSSGGPGEVTASLAIQRLADGRYVDVSLVGFDDPLGTEVDAIAAAVRQALGG